MTQPIDTVMATSRAGWALIENAPQGKLLILYYPPIFKAGRGKTHDAMIDIHWAPGHQFRTATHWMPLPEPPTTSTEL